MNISNESLLFTIIIALLASCNDLKIENPPMDQLSISECHSKQTWDSASIAKTLIGKWNWEYIGYYWQPEESNSSEYSDLQIEFKKNGVIKTYESGALKDSAIWELFQRDSSSSGILYGVDTDPYISNTSGRILICDDHVMFNNSYIDGNDNYYSKN